MVICDGGDVVGDDFVVCCCVGDVVLVCVWFC